ncbi:MAG: hypothetical protein J0H09_28025 [Burkholderiales bacterium]|nr:hypothetical protein [Burkholderiales bacterium]
MTKAQKTQRNATIELINERIKAMEKQDHQGAMLTASAIDGAAQLAHRLGLINFDEYNRFNADTITKLRTIA